MPEIFARRLALLTAAVAFATLSVTPSDAAVVTKALNLNLTNSASTTAPDSKTTVLDFDADGTNDFSFTHSTNPLTVTGPFGDKTDYNGKLTLDAADTSLFLSVVKDYDPLGPANNYAENLSVASLVGNEQPFIFIPQGGGSAYDNRLLDSSGDGNVGTFGDSENINADGSGYIGFAFGSAATPNYGYLEFSNLFRTGGYMFDDALNGATLVGVAYETTPGVAIIIAPIAVPEPASLAAIAGVALLGVSRRRRRA